MWTQSQWVRSILETCKLYKCPHMVQVLPHMPHGKGARIPTHRLCSSVGHTTSHNYTQHWPHHTHHSCHEPCSEHWTSPQHCHYCHHPHHHHTDTRTQGQALCAEGGHTELAAWCLCISSYSAYILICTSVHNPAHMSPYSQQIHLWERRKLKLRLKWDIYLS